MMHQEKSELKSDLQQENTISKDLKGTLDIGTRTHLWPVEHGDEKKEEEAEEEEANVTGTSNNDDEQEIMIGEARHDGAAQGQRTSNFEILLVTHL